MIASNNSDSAAEEVQKFQNDVSSVDTILAVENQSKGGSSSADADEFLAAWKSALVQRKAIYPSKAAAEKADKYTYNIYWPETVKSFEGDINRDGIKDRLYYFFPNDLGGNGAATQTEFANLKYSTKNGFKSDTTLNTTITALIKSQTGTRDFYATAIKYAAIYGDNILGNFRGWAGQDAFCCPSQQMDFVFNYSANTLRFSHKK